MVQNETSKDEPPLEVSSKAGVKNAIWNEIHRKRFYLAEQAPICKGELRGEFGYLAISKTAKDILAGEYDFPDDFDQPTRELLEEYARIRTAVPANSIGTCIRRQY